MPKGQVVRPQGLAVSGGRLIVADDLKHRLAIFGLDGDFVTAVGSGPGPNGGQLRNPYDVAVDPLGRVFVADNSNHRVVRYGAAPSYPYRARWGSYGSAAGQLQYPRGLSVDAPGAPTWPIRAATGSTSSTSAARRCARSAPRGACRASSSGRSAWPPTRAGCARWRIPSTAASSC